jgi:UDP-glucuronate decarboxylase
VTIGEIAREVIRVTGARVPVRYAPLPADDPRQRCPDLTLAARRLNWSPTTTLADGLTRTVRYFVQRAAPRVYRPHGGAPAEAGCAISAAHAHSAQTGEPAQQARA